MWQTEETGWGFDTPCVYTLYRHCQGFIKKIDGWMIEG